MWRRRSLRSAAASEGSPGHERGRVRDLFRWNTGFYPRGVGRGTFELVVTPRILTEYLRTCERLAENRPHLSYAPTLTRIIGHASLVAHVPEGDPITADPEDDKFMLAAKLHEATVVGGDSHLLHARGWNGVEVLRPTEFMELLAEQM